MTPKLSEHLKRKHQDLFTKDVNGDIRFGFSCSDGWFDLLDMSFSSVVNNIKGHNSHILQLIKKNEQSAEKVTVESFLEFPKMQQIKEKFGALRIYYVGGNEYAHGVFSLAQNQSTSICETCGKKGKLIQGGYIYTACEEHIKKDALKVEQPELVIDKVIYVLSFKHGMVTARVTDVENKVIMFSNESEWFETCPNELVGVKSSFSIEDINGETFYYEC